MRATLVNCRWRVAGSRVRSDVVFTSLLIASDCDFFATIGSNNCGGTTAEAGAGFVSVAVFSAGGFGVAGTASAGAEAALFVAGTITSLAARERPRVGMGIAWTWLKPELKPERAAGAPGRGGGNCPGCVASAAAARGSTGGAGGTDCATVVFSFNSRVVELPARSMATARTLPVQAACDGMQNVSVVPGWGSTDRQTWSLDW